MGWSAWDESRTSTFTVATTSADRAMADRVAADAPDLEEDVAVAVTVAADAAAARALVSEGEADAWLHRGDGGWVLTTDDGPESDLMTVTSEVVRTASLDEAAAAVGTTTDRLLAGSEVTSQYLRGDADKADLAQGVAFAFAFLFYMASLLFGIQLANSVVEEKQSRIVEIIATSIPVRQLLIGKVAGNSVLAVRADGALRRRRAGRPRGDALVEPRPRHQRPDRLVPRLLRRRLRRPRRPVGGRRLARLAHRGGPEHVGPDDDVVLLVFFGAMFLDGTMKTVFSFVPPFSAVLMPTRVLEGGPPGGSRSRPWGCSSSRPARSSSWRSGSTGARCSRPAASCRCGRPGPPRVTRRSGRDPVDLDGLTWRGGCG